MSRRTRFDRNSSSIGTMSGFSWGAIGSVSGGCLAAILCRCSTLPRISPRKLGNYRTETGRGPRNLYERLENIANVARLELGAAYNPAVASSIRRPYAHFAPLSGVLLRRWKVVRPKETRKMLLDAFERLKAGKPRHNTLRELALKGRQLVNIKNVALEAGVSRRLIGYEGCPYPDVRALILAYMASSPRPAISQALVDELRGEIRELRRQLELRDTYIAELMLELERLTRGRDGDQPEDDTVVNFRKDRRCRENRRHGPAN